MRDDEEVDFERSESDSNEPEAEKPDENYHVQYSYSYSESNTEVDLRSNTWATEHDREQARGGLRSWYEQNDWKRQRRAVGPRPITPEEIYDLASEAWVYNYERLGWVNSNPSKDFVTKNGRRYIDLYDMADGLNFNFESYSPSPKKVNGVPYWEKVVPYNACYLPQGDTRVCHKPLNQ